MSARELFNLIDKCFFLSRLIAATSIDADESRHFHHHHHPSLDDTDFVPIIPSQVDPLISLLHGDPHLSPIDFFSSFYHNRHHLSTSRPFAVRQISSTTSTQQQQQHVTSTRAPTTFDPAILGSGDFAVMRGGTFYPENEEEHYGSGSTFYDSNAGRPFALPFERSKQQKPQQFSDNPFANFKDFADITAGADVSDFSNLVVIYANRNSTKHEPRNILEQLQLLDQQNESENRDETAEVFSTSSPIKSTKLSKFKTKLRSTKLKQKSYAEKKSQQSKKQNKIEETPIDYVDPLVAES